ncbi:MAG: type II toxin-antitoxin system prevent-host-death family antitoxin [Microgenomates group bacterium]
MQNLQPLSTKELRDNLAEVLERVAIGKESFLVSKFGKEKALLIPVGALNNKQKSNKQKRGKRNLKNLSFYGIWKNRKEMKNSSLWVLKMRKRQSLRIRKIDEQISC